MPTSLTWYGNEIDTRSKPVGKYLFLATEAKVYVNGSLIAETRGFRSSESATGSFTDNDGKSHVIESTTKFSLLGHSTHTLTIDGQTIAEGPLKITQKFPMYIAWATLAAVAQIRRRCTTCGQATRGNRFQ